MHRAPIAPAPASVPAAAPAPTTPSNVQLGVAGYVDRRGVDWTVRVNGMLGDPSGYDDLNRAIDAARRISIGREDALTAVSQLDTGRFYVQDTMKYHGSLDFGSASYGNYRAFGDRGEREVVISHDRVKAFVGANLTILAPGRKLTYEHVDHG